MNEENDEVFESEEDEALDPINEDQTCGEKCDISFLQ
jgi:hypothetical protein